MSNKGNITPGAQPPEEFTGLRTSEPKTVAAGIPAVVSTANHILSSMNLNRAAKVLFKLNQVNGPDCPGCAWPDPYEHRSSLGEYCENGAKAIAEEATTRTIGPEFFKKYSIEELTRKSDYWLGQQGRITHPMILKKGSSHYESISWEKLFEHLGSALNQLKSPDEAIFYTSGRTSNEAAFLYQLFVREYGTNNLPDCSNMCHESSGVALSETLGIGKGSVTLEDFEKTDLIIVIGQNPGTNHPRMLSALKKAKKNGSKIISINPLPETGLIGFKNPQHLGDLLGSGTSICDLFLQVRINGDVALLKAIMCLLLEEENKKPGSVFDHEFIKENTVGYDELIKDLETHNIDDLIKDSGIPKQQVRETVNLLIANKKVIVCWAMGLTQHENGVDNIKELVNLLLLKGSIGKPGAGTCPVRGHSNVQGDRTMGIWEKPKPEFLNNLKSVFGFEPPRHHGYDTVEAIRAMAESKAKVFFAMGGNFLSATPDTEYTAKALKRCTLTAHVSTKLNRSHLIHGEEALILPCLGRTDIDTQNGQEQFVSVENSMGVVHRSKGNLKPVSKHLLSEPAIVSKLAQATLAEKSKVDWKRLSENYDHIRDGIEKVIPGFESYNKRVRQDGGFYLPNGAREGKFHTIEKKAVFSVTSPPKLELKDNEYMMMTIRSHDQFNTTIYGLDDRYRGIYHERRVIMMNPEDITSGGFKSGDIVDLINREHGSERIAKKFIIVSYSIPRKCTATYFPETNVLVPIQNTARKSNTPASKLVIISLSKHQG